MLLRDKLLRDKYMDQFEHGITVRLCYSRKIFDPNGSIPATVSCPAFPNYQPCSASIETSTLDFVIAATSIDDAGPCGSDFPPLVPGFDNIVYPGEYTGSSILEIDYSITTTPQTNIVFPCTGSDTSPVAIVVDAISFRGALGI